MSGCVVASDMPFEMEEVFRGVVIPLRQDMSAQEVQDVLEEYAGDKERLARMAGEATTEGRELLKVFTRESRVEAIAAAAGLVRLTEMDDIHIESTTTPSSVTVPVALGLAAQGAGSPADLESSLYVGTELVVRFGLAMDGSRSLMKGVWPTRAAAALGACATAARMLGLTREQAHEALSLALTMSAGRGGPFVQSPSGRWVLFGQALAVALGRLRRSGSQARWAWLSMLKS